MSEATLAASTAILKTKYPGGELPVEAYENNTLLAMAPKQTDFDGQNYVVALRTETPQGASASFAIAQANIAQGTYNRFTVTRVSDYAVARIRGEALKAAAKSSGALVDLWDSEMKGATHTALRSLAVMAYRDGTGIRGQISAGSNVGTTSITLATVADITNFAVNMAVQFTADKATLKGSVAAGTPPPNQIVITGIDRANGILTFGSVLNTVITGGNGAVAASDYILRSGDLNAVITGLAGWIPGGSTPGTLFGLNRNTDPVRLAGQLYNASGVPMHEALIEASARIGVEGGRPTHVFAHPRDIANMKKMLDAKVQYDRVSSAVAGISFSALELEGDNGKLKVLTDMNCPRNVAWVGELDTLKLHSLGPAPQILDYDTQQILRVSNDDVYEVRVGSYVSMWLNKPVGWCQVSNFGL